MTYTVAGLSDITSTVIKYGTSVRNNCTTTVNDNVVTVTYSNNTNYSNGEHSVIFTDSEGQTATATLNLVSPLSVSCVAIPRGSSAHASVSGAVGTLTATSETEGITTRVISNYQVQISASSDVAVGTYPVVFTDDNQSVTYNATVRYANTSVSTTGTCTRGGELVATVANAVLPLTATLLTSEAEGYITLTVNDNVVTIGISEDLPSEVTNFQIQFTDSRDNALTAGGNGYKTYNLV